MFYRIFVVVTVIGLMLSGSAVNSFALCKTDASNDEWDPLSAGPITSWTAPVCAKGEFVVQPFFFFNKTRGTFNSDGHFEKLPEGDKQYQYQEQLFMQYGVTDRFEIDAQTVYQENYLRQSDVRAHDKGMGDSYLYMRYCALEEKSWFPHLTGLLQLKMPSGKYQHLDPDKLETDSMGTGSWDPGFGVVMTKKLKPFILHADATYSFPQRVKVDDMKTKYARYFSYDVGVEYFLPKGFNLLVEANGFLQGTTRQQGEKVVDSNSRYLTIAPGIGWSNDTVQMLVVYQRIVAGKNTDANDSAVATCVYTF